jgi:Tol biopolymer transport system component
MRKLILCSTAILLVVQIVGNSVSAAKEPVQFQLAFERNAPSEDICIINMDGTGQYCLMQTDDMRDYNPVWSPDGHLLTFQSYAINGGTTPATTSLYDASKKITVSLPNVWPIYNWSLDSRYLLIRQAYSTESLVSDIAIVRPDGSEFHTLTDSQNTYSQPAWSPDGAQIAYLSGYPEATLMVMSAKGEDQRALTDGLAVNLEVQPQWSPDSQIIAFAVNDEIRNSQQTSEIYTIHTAGTDLQQLTDTGNINLGPRWSPDGTQLVFFGYPQDAFAPERSTDPTNMLTEVYRINADGSDLVSLSQNRGLDVQPAWSPDGEWIAFASTRPWESVEPRPGIFIMRPDGSDVRMVTNEPTFANGGNSANNPVWRPVPKD